MLAIGGGKLKSKKVVLIFLLFIVFANCAVEIFDPPHLRGSYRSPSLLLNRDFSTRGEVKLADPIDACSPLVNSKEVSGKIVLLTSSETCQLAEKINHVEEAKALAIIFFSFDRDAGEGAQAPIARAQRVQTNTNGVEVKPIEGLLNELASNRSVVIAQITPDENQYLLYLDAEVAFSVLSCSSAFVIMVICVYKGYQAHSLQLPINSLWWILIFNFLGAATRFIASIDPAFVYGIYPYEFGSLMVYFGFQFSLCSALILIFFWYSVIRLVTDTSRKKLYYAKIPLAALCCFVCGIEISSSFFRTFYPENSRALRFLSAFLYLILIALIFIAYIIMASRFTWSLWTVKRDQPTSRSRYSPTWFISFLVMSAVGYAIFWVGTGIFVIPQTIRAGDVVWGYILANFGITLASFSHLLMLSPEAAKTATAEAQIPRSADSGSHRVMAIDIEDEPVPAAKAHFGPKIKE